MAVDPHREALRELHRVARAINEETRPEKLYGLIMDSAIKLTRAERGFLILVTPGVGMDVKAARSLKREHIENPEFEVSRGIILEALKSGMPVIVGDAKQDTEFGKRRSVTAMRLASVACVPLKARGRLLGVLYLDNRYRSDLFEAEDLLMLETFADHAAIALAAGSG
jgi:GAF domain-containing protein